jgi:hypothetical protein
MAAAQILISPPVYHLNVGLLSIVFWKLDHYCVGPLVDMGEQELFSDTACIYLLTYIQYQCLHVICCCMLPCILFTRCHALLSFFIKLTTIFAAHQIQLCCVLEDAGIEPSSFSACSDSHTYPRWAKPHRRSAKYPRSQPMSTAVHMEPKLTPYLSYDLLPLLVAFAKIFRNEWCLMSCHP